MDTNITSGQAEHTWLDRAEEVWAKARAMGAVEDADVLSVSLSTVDETVCINVRPDAAQGIADWFGLDTYQAKPLTLSGFSWERPGTYHDWSGTRDGVKVHVVTVTHLAVAS